MLQELCQQPLVGFEPKSTWTPHTTLPTPESLRGAVVSLDLETCDPGIKTKGPGGYRGEGHVIGFALGTSKGSYYIHKPELGEVAWLKRVLGEVRYVVFANALYDLEWLDVGYGIRITDEKIRDIQVAEPLIDENRNSYSLESLGKLHCRRGKDERLLEEAVYAYELKDKGDLWKLPARYIGPYAEADAQLTLDVWEAQQPQLKGVADAFNLECMVTPILARMRASGVGIDVSAAQALYKRMTVEEERLSRQVPGVNVWSAKSVAGLADRLGVAYGYTNSGEPSLEGSWLEAQGGLLEVVAKIREINRIRQAFLKDSILDRVDPDKRLRCVWHQMRDMDGGTRTGRMSASRPNLQQIPTRSEWGKELRKLFVTPGGGRWIKMDYSQQEPRLLVHFGVKLGLKGAQEVADLYKEGGDLYLFLQNSLGITRDRSKMLTLALIYGMQDKTLSEQLGCSKEDALDLRKKVYARLPFLEEIVERAKSVAGTRGYVKTLSGRRCHFDEWQPLEYSDTPQPPVRGESHARVKWPGKSLKRAYLHKALNRIIQGSAADMTKRAMVAIREQTGMTPLLAVHDELAYEASTEWLKDLTTVKHVAETCLPLCVPVKADVRAGVSWGG